MSPVDKQLPDKVDSSSLPRINMENPTTETSVETDVMRLLSPTAILARMARNTAANNVTSSNDHHGLVGIAPPTWGESKRRFDDSYSTSSSGTHSTRITANHRKSMHTDLLEIANPDDFMDLSNPNDDLLNVSLDILENCYDRRDDSSITLASNDDVLPSSKAIHYSALHTIFSGEENDARHESQSTSHTSSGSSCFKSASRTDDNSSEAEEETVTSAGEQSSPHSGSSGSTPPKDRFGLPLLPFSHELFQKIKTRRRIVDQQLKEQEEQESRLAISMGKRAIVPHASTAVDLIVHEEKKEEEATVEVDQLTHHWFEKLMIELKSEDFGSSTLQFPGQRAKGRTTDKDLSNQPMLPNRQENETMQHSQSSSSWIILHASSRKLMMIRSRSVPILSFFGVPSRKNSPRGVPSRNEMFQQFVDEYKKYVEESATPEELYRKRVADRKRTWSQDLIENRYYEVRSRALFQLEESKRSLHEFKRENV